MTCSTTADNTRMVHGGATFETDGVLMTGFTSGCSLHMIARLTFSGAAIMAVCTTRGDTTMIHCNIHERSCRPMTGFTAGASGDVGARFTQGFFAIMTAGTASGDAAVVHGSATFEAGGVLVTGFTGSTGDDMGAGFGFDVGKAAAVTGRTARGDAAVVHRGRDKGYGVFVASLATGAGREVGARFTQGFFAIMTAGTASGDAAVVHGSATFEAGGVLVTGFTGSDRLHMTARLT